jgi:hypothetical protein
MRLTRTTEIEREPIGIVIADGGRGDAAPRLAAFVWGPVPEDEELPEHAPLLLAGAA